MPSFALLIENPKIKRQNVRLMIGNGVSVLVITVIQLFNCILTNVRGETERVYERPKEKVVKPPDSKVVEWFKSRGISQSTLTDLRVGEGTEYMPQTGKPENTIKFNYFMGGDLINIKYRDGRKNFKII
jgi:hypothetical protein